MKSLIRRLKESKEVGEYSNLELAGMLGKSPPRISEYLHGVSMPTDVEQKVKELLGDVEPEVHECELEYVTPSEVALRMGKSEQMVRFALQQGKLPFGVAVQGSGDSYQYWIFRGAFERFLREMK